MSAADLSRIVDARNAASEPMTRMDAIMSDLCIPEIPRMPQIPEHITNPAGWTRTRLLEHIRDFEAELDEEHEICARLVSFGQAITFHIQNIGYYGPDIISFDGITDSGETVKLVQHTSQLSVLLMAAKKLQPTAKRIGFRATGQENA